MAIFSKKTFENKMTTLRKTGVNLNRLIAVSDGDAGYEMADRIADGRFHG
jgi:hypothetical protein